MNVPELLCRSHTNVGQWSKTWQLPEYHRIVNSPITASLIPCHRVPHFLTSYSFQQCLCSAGQFVGHEYHFGIRRQGSNLANSDICITFSITNLILSHIWIWLTFETLWTTDQAGSSIMNIVQPIMKIQWWEQCNGAGEI